MDKVAVRARRGGKLEQATLSLLRGRGHREGESVRVTKVEPDSHARVGLLGDAAATHPPDLELVPREEERARCIALLKAVKAALAKLDPLSEGAVRVLGERDGRRCRGVLARAGGPRRRDGRHVDK